MSKAEEAPASGAATPEAIGNGLHAETVETSESAPDGGGVRAEAIEKSVPATVQQTTVNVQQSTILELADAYLASGNAQPAVRKHLPILLIAAAAKVANARNAQTPLLYYGLAIPYRFQHHVLLLGASGDGKGAVVTQFFQIINDDPTAPIWPHEEFKGGTIQGLRGGMHDDGTGKSAVAEGALQRMKSGFIHVPEFSQLIDVGRNSGLIQTLLAWMDTGKMEYDMLSTGHQAYDSDASLVMAMQIGLLDSAETSVKGLNRRCIYEIVEPRWTAEILEAGRNPATVGEPAILKRLREALRSMRDTWAPTALDFSEIGRWFDQAVGDGRVSAPEKQVVLSIAIGHHMVSGGNLTGPVVVKLTPELETVLRRATKAKEVGRMDALDRGAQHALRVLEDPSVLGRGQRGSMADIKRLVANRMSISERYAGEYLNALVRAGDLESTPNASGTKGRPSPNVRLSSVLIKLAGTATTIGTGGGGGASAAAG